MAINSREFPPDDPFVIFVRLKFGQNSFAGGRLWPDWGRKQEIRKEKASTLGTVSSTRTMPCQ